MAMPKRKAQSTARFPVKRNKGIGGEKTWEDGTAREIASHLASERAGGGEGYLSTRPDQSRKGGNVRSLQETALRASADGFLEALLLPSPTKARVPDSKSSSNYAHAAAVARFGYDPAARQSAAAGEAAAAETRALRDSVASLPEEVRNRLLDMVMLRYMNREEDARFAGRDLREGSFQRIFLQPGTTSLRLSFGANLPRTILSRVPDCTSLGRIDLSNHTKLQDGTAADLFDKLGRLEKVNLRNCLMCGDKTVTAIARTAGANLKDINLSFTAVGVKGLTHLLAKCPLLEVLKAASIAHLGDAAINKIIDTATDDAVKLRHLPLSNLRTLKLRGTDLTDASLGRLLTLCAPSLTSLDIASTQVKSLDLVSRSLHLLPHWRLEKLVISGLPVSSRTLVGFFRPLAERPAEEREVFRKLKMANMGLKDGSKELGDAELKAVLPWLRKLEGMESVSLADNKRLGTYLEPLGPFVEVFGRRCTSLDLSNTMLQDHHLEFLLPPDPLDFPPDPTAEPEPPLPNPPRIQSLILDGTRITDNSASFLRRCTDLRLLHTADTKISTAFLLNVLDTCVLISSLNLTSCRGVPVQQRRTFFDALAKGEVVP